MNNAAHLTKTWSGIRDKARIKLYYKIYLSSSIVSIKTQLNKLHDMNYEIERKFLVEGDYKSHAFAHYRIVQGYLSSAPQRGTHSYKGDTAYLTVKSNVSEMNSHFEWKRNS